MSLQTIRDVAQRDVVTAHPDTNASHLARLMQDEGVGSVVVVVDNHPIGIVTDRDLAMRITVDDVDESRTYARKLMRESPATIRDDVGIAVAARKMVEHGVRRLPVVNKGGKLVGIVSFDDIHRELVAEQEHPADIVAAEPPE